jgi:hypothetical protein
MPKGFKYWFGELDLNNPLDEDFVSAMHSDEAGTLLVLALVLTLG